MVKTLISIVKMVGNVIDTVSLVANVAPKMAGIAKRIGYKSIPTSSLHKRF